MTASVAGNDELWPALIEKAVSPTFSSLETWR